MSDSELRRPRFGVAEGRCVFAAVRHLSMFPTLFPWRSSLFVEAVNLSFVVAWLIRILRTPT